MTKIDNSNLSAIYRRQFKELAPLRRFIYSQLPLRVINTIFEPGCGTGLLGNEIQNLTEAAYTGMDIDSDILPAGKNFVTGNALKNPISADLYVSSFFFSSVKKPVNWLKAVRKKLISGGLFVVFAEYDYGRIEETPDIGLAKKVRNGLAKNGINTTNGGELDLFFQKAGFRKVAGGEVQSSFQKPDRVFLEMHAENIPDELPLMSWCVRWGIWRNV